MDPRSSCSTESRNPASRSSNALRNSRFAKVRVRSSGVSRRLPTVRPMAAASRLWLLGMAPCRNEMRHFPNSFGGSYGWNSIQMATVLVSPPASAPNPMVTSARRTSSGMPLPSPVHE